MARVYFHCSNAEVAAARTHTAAAAMGDLSEIYEQAVLAMQALIAAPNLEDWRGWVLHISDESGEEMFRIPFAPMLGRPH